MKNLEKMVFGFDRENKRAFLSIDGIQFFMTAENAKEAWRKAYSCYRAEMNPLPYMRLSFSEV